MKKASSTIPLSGFFILLCSVSLASSESALENFLQCLPNHVSSSYPISEAIFLPTNSLFNSTLQAYIKNLRFLTPTTPRPLAIVAAKHESHVQATVICAKSNGMQIRIRSGGHDYEAISYTSKVPYIVLDMFNLRAISIQANIGSAWVEAGATTGELYYQIANQSSTLAFPAGVCTTLGAGGHFSGGGYGNLMRKFGLSVDNIADAKIVDVNGKILDRASMGEDLFWAIRGGDGASFGVILAWKINLVQIPSTVTVFRVGKTLDQGATDILYRWQEIAPNLDTDLFIRAMPKADNGSIEVFFIGQFLGQTDRLLPLINRSFPELGLQRQDCHEMSWIESILFWVEFPNGTSTEVLLDRPPKPIVFSKLKSDYAKDVIPKSGIEEIWKMMLKVGKMWMQWNPYGGRMSEIPETDTPFPHRAGYRFLIQYTLVWQDEGIIEKQVNMLREMHQSMTPYVSKDPREAFLNYRDLDIGSNPSNSTNFQVAEVYGSKYFKDNFLRLTKVKARVDPDNFFKHEQSIPPFVYINK
ncbi:Reticuline oxidase precursor, putative [Ricinus communis]|uniref:Reticuline oxidase, putative n=1 Tax=Ricinus communis TaxID=3988 RepID=B9SAZ4_RICCO|nr:Reticuline oxidase precursor, putative [Ricinus communis]|eukprot:XP_002523154.1 berberine bridge enzyme-like 17 [Ricinus communis]